MSSKKLPAIQFYPSDWKNDTKVRSLSFHDRGIWFELLLIMHVAENRGKLMINGKKMPDIMLAKMIGCSKQTITKSLETIVKNGVAYIDDNGIIYNKRMVEDQDKRDAEAAFGSLGGNKKKEGKKARGAYDEKTPPSLSYSVTDSSTNSECVLHLRKVSVDNDDWLTQVTGATKIPTHTLISFCNNWITNAELRRLFEDYPPNKLLSMMVQDLQKEIPKLETPKPEPEKISHRSMWFGD
jgi:uncharacterized protein YdaU (DUF1376 family)